MQTVRVEAKNGSYDILIGDGILGNLCEYLKDFTRKLIVTDDIVYDLYKDYMKDCEVIVIPAGEQSKSHEMLFKIYDKMCDMRMTRSDVAVAFGGGVIGDLTGYAAASFKRGIKFIQVPTTLLAQVDSSVGGKVAVNLPKGKNMVGAFYQPCLVLEDTKTLDTLDKKQYAAGMAEVIKYAFIYDANLYEILTNEDADIAKIVKRCCEIKAEYVDKDPFDTGIRMQLNYGHTIGHAIETVSGYGTFLHGEGVAIGMVFAAKIGEKLGVSPKGLEEKTVSLLKKYNLPYEIDENTLNKAIDILLLDKKAEGKKINFILIDKIGHAVAKKLGVDEIKELLA